MALPIPVVARVSEVRCAPIGPGLWPGPRRQARRAGRDPGAQGWVPDIVSAKRLETMSGCP
jgi:hypothetical protein